MTQTKRQATGIVLKTTWDDGSTYVSIGCVRNLKMPGLNFAIEEGLVCLDDTSAPTRTLGDEEQSEATGQLVMDSGQIATADTEDYRLWALAESKDEQGFRIEFPTGQRMTFNGKLRQFEPAGPVEQKDWLLYDFAILRTSDITRELTPTTTTTAAP